ncbi:chemotaxis protein CheD [Viridibacillus sp. FSL R5-0477]|uniref:Probable chemoreceptor glutamine deamidase CheD n=1 Tax=Viridibacillus arenosi FSL R5-213 TaxID=1227360 RepID=W4EZC6_9BACL|nr:MULTISPECIES: chemotaxis protein CheD [Viridibacillus]ETT85880.1 chemoreceptor glutamine deamidase cheD [Viridibacillus arenosi FSL R5-213]OMC82872.1 chemotaxis protein CheD [Viridibacillus sp. FSL H8-0123]OMC88791.1 chemotaxis protein CheD [Viridibacillus sp. FSL H7-0596]OMC93419.1 chemotaxis protein CheD [Viridibacillus arenosi]
MIDSPSVVKVGIAQMDVAKAPNTIRTSGLGSCVGVVLYDESKGIAGLIHVMLPDSQLGRTDSINVAKFADTGIPAMVNQLKQEGIQLFKLKAKIAGGAQMFQFTSSRDSMRIGPRNVEAVKLQLKKLSIPLIAEDTGGSSGRTIEFDLQTTKLNIRTVNQGVKDI